MCGKIQHTTTFASVYLLTLLIVSEFCRATRTVSVEWLTGDRDDTRHALYGAFRPVSTHTSGQVSLLEHVLLQMSVDSGIRGSYRIGGAEWPVQSAGVRIRGR